MGFSLRQTSDQQQKTEGKMYKLYILEAATSWDLITTDDLSTFCCCSEKWVSSCDNDVMPVSLSCFFWVLLPAVCGNSTSLSCTLTQLLYRYLLFCTVFHSPVKLTPPSCSKSSSPFFSPNKYCVFRPQRTPCWHAVQLLALWSCAVYFYPWFGRDFLTD